MSLPKVNHYSIEVTNSGGVRRSALSPDEITSLIHDDARTLPQVLERGQRLSSNGSCLGWQAGKPEYSWITYGEVIQRAKHFSSGLVHMGMEPGQSTFVGIYSKNCVEWVLSEHACYNQSTVTVPLYDTLGPASCKYIINQTEMELVICDREEKAKSLVASASETPSLKSLVVISSASENLRHEAKEKGINVYLFKDVENLGKLHPCPAQLPKSEDLATICYTSGTTGDPKGVMITHANLISSASATHFHLGDHAPNHNDVYISFLPMAHMMERFVLVMFFLGGGSVGFWRGDLTLLVEDMQILRPTIMTSVPRLLNKIYDRVIAKVNSSKMKKAVFYLALNRKLAAIKRTGTQSNTIWDKLVFKPIRESLGGRVRLIASSAAPLSETVITFARCAFGCEVFEAYGQTETAAPCAMGVLEDLTPRQVGPPLPCSEIKLIDVPEMEYFAAKGHGEICVRGSNVFKGYYKLPDKTAEALDPDRWVHTGDIGLWLPNGTLKIIDRKKHIFKLSQGEYIAPEKIENIYVGCEHVDQIFVYGESLKSCLVGIVVPDRITVEAWCKEKHILGDWDELCSNKLIKNMILSELTAVGKASGLNSFEQVKDIYLHAETFTYENGFLTPTSKVKRLVCKSYFKDQIKDMYKTIQS